MSDSKKVLDGIKNRIMSEVINDSPNFDRLTYLRRSKELIGFIKANFDGFAPVLDAPITDLLTIDDYKKMYKILAKITVNSIDFTEKMKVIVNRINPPQSTQKTVKETQESPAEKESQVDKLIEKREKKKNDEPWVI